MRLWRVSRPETHPYFPSGEWEGFYTYRSGASASQHRMEFYLDFKKSTIKGSGTDDVGSFYWTGSYDTESLKTSMTKKYHGRHKVKYEGNVDENGIWGTWSISDYMTGGFHIWPKPSTVVEEEEEEQEEILEEVAVKTLETVA